MWVRFPPGPVPRRRARRDPPSRLILLAFASAALHLAVLALLLLRPPGRPEVAAPPAEFAMVFQSGAPTPRVAAAPARPARPPTPPPASPPATALPPAPAVAKPTPPAAPVVQPKHEAPRVPAKPPVMAQPVVRPNLPSLVAPPIAMPRPVEPKASPPTRAREAPTAVARKAAPPAPRPAAHANRQTATHFPAPIMRNFFIPSTASSGAQRLAQAVLSNEATPVHRSSRNPSYDLQGADELGPDWINTFIAWFKDHSIYPPQAILNDEEGNSTVEFTVDRYGRVTGVRLVRRSGSVWLDMETTGVLRDAHVPPFPYGTRKDDLTMHFTVHYILIRGP